MWMNVAMFLFVWSDLMHLVGSDYALGLIGAFDGV